MQMLSEDDLDLREMTDEELERAWDLWFDLAQSTNDADPPYSHGVLVVCPHLGVCVVLFEMLTGRRLSRATR
jgi:hypothetical protein